MPKERFSLTEQAAKSPACLAVDLDGTLAKSVPGKFDRDKIGEPIPAMVKKVKDAIESGKKVVVFTARAAEKENIPPIRKWLKQHGLGDLDVTNEKTPEMTAFWDDRARRVKKDRGTFEARMLVRRLLD